VTDARPIGFFDSGIGGVAVLAAVHRLLPAERLIYYADNANFPYGSKSAAEVRALSRAATDVLLQYSPKLIVVACNTASTAALADLRRRYDLPFVGMVPAVKPASSLSKSRRVGVLATEGTSHGQALADLIDQFANGATVTTVPAPGLAELVETGAPPAKIEATLKRFLAPLLEQGTDVVVLGCTHYFFLRPLVEEAADVTVIDSAEPVARRVAQVLAEAEMLAAEESAGSVEYLTSGDSQELARVLDHWRRAGSDIP
jgi:glutamate racemase